MKQAPHMEEPMNAMERFMAHISYRLDIIIEQNNSIIDFLAKQNDVPVTNNKAEIQVEQPAPKKKPTRKKQG